jgi:hypothetical protein
MKLVNPFTGTVLNANPKGCNQYSGPECTQRAFRGTKRGLGIKAGPHQKNVAPGHWFNTSRSTAELYGGNSGEVLEAELNLGKHADNLAEKLMYEFMSRGVDLIEAERKTIRLLRRKGFNSMSLDNPEGGVDFVAFRPGQVKLSEPSDEEEHDLSIDRKVDDGLKEKVQEMFSYGE